MIKSRYLNEQIKSYFGKEFNQMSDEEKNKITMIALSSKDLKGKLTDAKIAEVGKIPNIKRCVFQGFRITDEDIELLSRIDSLRGVQFSSCSFDGIKSSLQDLELIVLDGCENVPNALFLDANALRFLRIINQGEFDVSALARCQELEKAYLQKTVLRNLNVLGKLRNLKYVNLDCSRFNLLTAANLKRKTEVEFKLSGEPERGGL